MKRIDHPSATTDKKFTEGDPTRDIKATVVTADWLNVLQEELINMAIAGGVTPDQTSVDINQLLEALVMQVGLMDFYVATINPTDNNIWELSRPRQRPGVTTDYVHLHPLPKAYVEGLTVRFRAPAANTATTTVRFSGLTESHPLREFTGSRLVANKIAQGDSLGLVYCGGAVPSWCVWPQIINTSVAPPVTPPAEDPDEIFWYKNQGAAASVDPIRGVITPAQNNNDGSIIGHYGYVVWNSEIVNSMTGASVLPGGLNHIIQLPVDKTYEITAEAWPIPRGQSFISVISFNNVGTPAAIEILGNQPPAGNNNANSTIHLKVAGLIATTSTKKRFGIGIGHRRAATAANRKPAWPTSVANALRAQVRIEPSGGTPVPPVVPLFPPSIVPNFAADLSVANQVILTWDEPTVPAAAPVLEYNIKYTFGIGITTQTWIDVEGDVTTRTKIITPVDTGYEYYFQIRARNSEGWGPFTAVLSALPDRRPSSVNLRVTQPSRTEQTLLLQWDLGQGTGSSQIVRYELEQASDLNGSPNPTSWTSIDVPNTVPVTQQKRIYNLTVDQRYHFRCRAVNFSDLKGPWSNASYNVTGDPGAITDLKVYNDVSFANALRFYGTFTAPYLGGLSFNKLQYEYVVGSGSWAPNHSIAQDISGIVAGQRFNIPRIFDQSLFIPQGQTSTTVYVRCYMYVHGDDSTRVYSNSIEVLMERVPYGHGYRTRFTINPDHVYTPSGT